MIMFSSKKFGKKSVEDIIALTPMQQGMLFHYLKDPGEAHYFEQLSIGISGPLDMNYFKQAWNIVVDTNEMLRAVFQWERLKHPIQVILKNHHLKPEYYDLTSTAKAKSQTLQDVKESDRNETFDLREVPFRVTLCKLDENRFEMIISSHHILYDGWSIGIILKDFFKAYDDLCNKKNPVTPGKTKFKEFVKWIKTRTRTANRNMQEKFWKNYFNGFDTPTRLPGKKTNAKKESSPGHAGFSIAGTRKNQLDNFVKNEGITLASFFYSIWGILLQKYNNHQDVVFGTTVAGRPAEIKGIEDMVGLFINTVPLRVNTLPDDNEKIIELLLHINQSLQLRTVYEHTPLTDIKEYSEIDNADELFDTIVVIENYPLSNRMNQENSKLSIVSYSMFEMTHYHLTLNITVSHEIHLTASFNKFLFEEENISRLLDHFQSILNSILDNPHVNQIEIETLSKTEKEQILYEFNRTNFLYPHAKPLHELFIDQVKRTPDQVSLVCPNSNHYLTYRQLNEASNQMACRLKTRGVNTGDILGIMFQRSPEMMIGIFAILKSGAVYLPIDPNYPEQRKYIMLTDCNAKLVLTAKDFSVDWEKIKATFQPPGIRCWHQIPAYVIYTSGSTGRPKGVIIEHGAIVNRLNWMQKAYPIEKQDVILQKTPIGFDVSIWELFWWSFQGASLCLLEPGGEKKPPVIAETIRKFRISTLHFVPSMLTSFLAYLEDYSSKCTPRFSSLRQVFSSGEELTVDQLEKFNRFLKKINGTRLINLYGPTEAAVDVSYFNCQDRISLKKIPIGKPIDNIRLFILDFHFRLQPIGIPGELGIAGVGLARGYLNQPGFTSEKFCLRRPGGRFLKKLPPWTPRKNFLLNSNWFIIYKTGDLTRWLPDGNIEFLGRIDNQVKIRGFRIELGEIEAHLINIYSVKEAVVLLRKDYSGDGYLCAYLVFHQGKKIPTSEIKEILSGNLPYYMLPAYFAELTALPLTPNGKIDRTALEQIKFSPDGKTYTPPRNLIEQKLVIIMSEVLFGPLECPNIGIDDNFFQLGGHSLKAIQLTAKIYKELQVNISVDDLFKFPTVRQIAQIITKTKKIDFDDIEKSEKKEFYSLSFNQKRLWIIHRIDPASLAYNITGKVEFKEAMNETAVKKALEKLCHMHESLRTGFKEINGEPVQFIMDTVDLPFTFLDLTSPDDHENLANASKIFSRESTTPFDLSRPPLFNFTLLKLDLRHYEIIINIHHIIADGWSLEVLKKDFFLLYKTYKKDQEVIAPFLELYYTYKDFAQWQNKRLNNKELNENAANYWRKIVEKGFPALKLPYDFQSNSITSRDTKLNGKMDRNVDSGLGYGHRFIVGKDTKDELNRLALDNNTTLFTVMFAAYNILLSYFTSQEEIVSSIISAGREHFSIQKIVGVFVNAVVVNLAVNPELTFNHYLKNINGNVRETFQYQHYPLELVLDQMKVPFPDVSTAFNMLNMHENTREIIDDEMTTSHIETLQNVKYDIVLFVTGYQNNIEVLWHYKKACFKPATIRWLAAEYQQLLKEIARDSHKKIKDYKLFDAAGLEIIGNRIKPGNEYLEFKKEEIEQSITSRFESMVKKYPGNTAIKLNGQVLSYDTLNRCANRVARITSEKYDDRYRLNEKEKIRYNRQLMLHKWGMAEQEKLKSTTVFAAGAGGSGSPLIIQLALMGIGTIITCDFDEVELSNLNRQLLHDESRIGMNKAYSTQMTIKQINPHVRVIPISQKLTENNVHELVGDAEIIFDNLDDLEAKFALSGFAVKNNIPHIISSMIDLNAYAAVLNSPETPCFHCIHDRSLLDEIEEIKSRVKNYRKNPNPAAPPPLFISTGLVANEAIKILLGFENPAYNKFFFMNQRGTPDIVDSQGYRLITYTFTEHFKRISKNQGFDWDVGWRGKFLEELEIEADPSCPICKDTAGKPGNPADIITIKEKEAAESVDKLMNDGKVGDPVDNSTYTPTSIDSSRLKTAALVFGHNPHMIVGILAALKANKAYVPLDPSFPPERLQFMLEDSGARVILTDNSNFNLAVKIKDNVNKNIPVINVDEIYKDERIPGGNLNLPVNPGSAAYVLYTSGSTGVPKGVKQNHRNVLHFARVYTNALHIHPGDRLTLLSSYGFDAAKMDIFGALLNGAALYPYDIKQEDSLDRLPNWLRKERITIFHSIPTVYRYFIRMLNPGDRFPDIRFVVMGGEAVYKSDVDKYKRHFPDTCIFINGLGPTESTVTLQHFINKESEVHRESVPVGYPVEETNVFLLNGVGEEARIYEPGEIVFKSDYLAPGYLNNREKTDEVFGTDPLTNSGRIYRTGDLGRRLPGGMIEYIGRKDFQVKIRGYRIELAEIESKLDTIDGIKKSVVVCQQDSNKEGYLAAFYTKNQEQMLDELHVTGKLKTLLPDYMIPNVFWCVDDFPLTATGKIDRNALTKWKKGRQETGARYEPPQNPVEEKLVELWQEVLEIDRIGIDDNFFVYGGNSLKAIVLISKIHKALHVKVPLAEIFKSSDIRKLSRYLQKSVTQQHHSIEPIEDKMYYDVSSAQKRLYILNYSEGISRTYNLYNIIIIEGQPDIHRFEDVFPTLIKRHESLRTAFDLIDGRYVQIIHREVDFQIEYFEKKEDELKDVFGKFGQPFDLKKAPLLRIGLIKLEWEGTGEKYGLIYDMHHIISDGISMGILIGEFIKLYERKPLPPLKIQYRDFAEWQNERFSSEEMKKQEKYWCSRMKGEIPCLRMPLDFKRPTRRTFAGSTFTTTIPFETVKKMTILAREKNVTQNIILFAIYTILTAKYCYQQDIIIGSLVAGRRHADLENIMGMFANFLPIRNHVLPHLTFTEFLESVKNTLVEAYENQDYPYENIVENISTPMDSSRNPLFDTMLILHNEINPGINLEIQGLKFYAYGAERDGSTLDIKLDIFPGIDGGLNCRWEYNVNLFKQETIKTFASHFNWLVDKMNEYPGQKIRGLELFNREEKMNIAKKWANNSYVKATPIKLVISATFTPEPVEEYIRWWGQQLMIDIHVQFAFYNQVFRGLLDEASLISTNQSPGINVLLVRFEDFLRELDSTLCDEEKCQKLESGFRLLVEILENKKKLTTYFIGIFPVSTHLSLSPVLVKYLEKMNTRWKCILEEMENDGVKVIDFRQLKDLYRIREVFDPVTDKEGHVPFSQEFYAAMGTVIAREISGIENEPLGHPLLQENLTGQMILELTADSPVDNVDNIVSSTLTDDEPPKNATQKKLLKIWQGLLKIKNIGINTSFFKAGGNSLRAVVLISKIHKEFNVILEIKDIFDHPTISQLSRVILKSLESVYKSIKSSEQKEYYPLSSPQKRLYVIQQLEPGNLAYNIPSMLELTGVVQKEKLEGIFIKLIQRHECLRTSIHLVDGEPVQRINDRVELEIKNYDLAAEFKKNTKRKKEKEIESAANVIREFVRTFDLSQTPLVRVGLAQLDENRCILMIDMHHIISDGVSIGILIRDFNAMYEGKQLSVLVVQYKDYAQWLHTDPVNERIQGQSEYWLKQFQGEIPILDLPTDFARPVEQAYEGKTAVFEMDEESTRNLRTFAANEEVTLFAVLLSVFYIFLFKLSGQEDIIVGTPIAGRRHWDLENIMGMFVNTLPLRSQPRAIKTFKEFFTEVMKDTLTAFEYQEYPFEDLINRLDLNRDLSRNPIFDVMFVLQNMEDHRLVLEPLKPYKFEKGISRFDLTLEVYETGEKLIFRLEYCTALFKPETIKKYIGYFLGITASLVQCPHWELWEIEITTEEEKKLLLYTFNDTQAKYPKNMTIHQLFAEQVEKYPDQVAVVGKNPESDNQHLKKIQMARIQSSKQEETAEAVSLCLRDITKKTYITYRELNERVHQLACLLKERGVRQDTIVGIMVERTEEIIIGMLGILKGGGAYLPIDPGYPPERIRFILTASDVKIVVTAPKLRLMAQVDDNFNRLPGLSLTFINIEINIETEPINGLKSDFSTSSTLPCSVSPANLAYVIYTSGSTGNPKGVIIRHQNAINFITGMTGLIDFSPGKSILALTTISFDISFLETLLPLTCGLKIVIADENQQKDPQLLEKVIIVHNVDIVQFTPSRLQLILNMCADMSCLQRVQELLIGGEAFPVNLYEVIKEKLPGKIYNVYGPTETTIWSTVKELSGSQPGPLTIGTPIANTRIYIVEINRHTLIQPVGIPGELLIGGDGVAAGYLNNPELTEEKFIKFSHLSSTYMTGDLTRWLPNGEIEFLGRLDDQVKIRGFRIDLEEIEEQLMNNKNIREAVVLKKSNWSGHNYLCAYIIPNISPGSENTSDSAASPGELNISELRNILLKQLPDYMIPSDFVQLETMPLTPNGKVDRKALLHYKGKQLKTGATYVTPETKEEKLAVCLWQDLLQREKVSVHDNFFDLGGNSMNIIQLNAQLKKTLGKDVPLVAMFRYPTIRSLLRYLDEEGGPDTKIDEEMDEMESVMNETIGLWDTLMDDEE